MATFKERLDNTKEIISDDSVTMTEAWIHLYYWFRFEYAIVQRNRAALRAEKYAGKLNTNLEVFQMRKQMTKL